MALNHNFPKSPYEILNPDIRWFPGEADLYKHGYAHLLPPLVDKIRREVHAWRDNNYSGVSDTSKSLLNWWFKTEHYLVLADNTTINFQYYFAQREAVESVIWLFEVANVKDKYDLIRYDSSGAVSTGMFDETWLRFVIKMATGSGKTKVLSLLIAWSYFHKLYEPDSKLARNFLLIAPNIIVLDRLRTDFDGLKIFYNDPVIPENGFDGKDWNSDFHLDLHIQDEVNLIHQTGNLFLTNIHRVYESDINIPTFEDDDTSDYFLGTAPKGKTLDSKIDLTDILKNIDELVVLNDEAHHIHDEKLAWFKSIQEINNRLLFKNSSISLQIDVTATPKKNNGSIFVQTISDYPLVEAIYQEVVKRPVLPNKESRNKLKERTSSKYSERYRDYLNLGVLEWKKTFDVLIKTGKKSVLFVMTDDTKNCDEVAEYLEKTFPELQNSVLVIHTKNNGDLIEGSQSKNKDELEKLRKAAKLIDEPDNKYKAIVSVLMLKEGWDVRNVTTIVGLRPYNSSANILPEQTLGRGLRKMFFDNNVDEVVSVVGTNAFIDFVESIEIEGVTLEQVPMGQGSNSYSPLLIEIDNSKKDLDNLNIKIPVLSPKNFRDFNKLSEFNIQNSEIKKYEILSFDSTPAKEIKFKFIVSDPNNPDDNIHHTTELPDFTILDSQTVLDFFTENISKSLKLFSGKDLIYKNLKFLISEKLFGKSIDLNNENIIKNLSRPEISDYIYKLFISELNKIIISEKENSGILDYININSVRPFTVKNCPYYIPKKCSFNRIIGDSDFELNFASFLDSCDDIISFTKNYFAIGFKLDYVNSHGDLSNYTTDFIVNQNNKNIYFIETKGMKDEDTDLKLKRLDSWCKDVNSLQSDYIFNYLYIPYKKFNELNPNSFSDLIKIFSE
ncbi:MAG: DEAD/DEAH box helicase family protein [Ignavibacteria bacterium]|nr:DEAD/DEAH box helicase family protein [Ignavibacteria bacterium]